MIIGISGKIGSGKDTIAKIIIALERGKIMFPHSYSDEKFNQTIIDTISSSSILKPISHNDWQVKKFAGKLKQVVALFIGCTVEDLEDQEFKNKPLDSSWNKYQLYDFMKPRDKWFFNYNEARDYCHRHNNSQHAYTVVETPLTPRLFMQLLGTDCFRDIIHPNAHVNGLFADYGEKFVGNLVKESDLGDNFKYQLPNWLITDVRFPNEADAIDKIGGYLLRVNRQMYHIDGYVKPIQEVPKEERDIIATNVKAPVHESEIALDNYGKFDAVIDNNGSIEDLIETIKKLNII